MPGNFWKMSELKASGGSLRIEFPGVSGRRQAASPWGGLTASQGPAPQPPASLSSIPSALCLGKGALASSAPCRWTGEVPRCSNSHGLGGMRSVLTRA